MITQYDLRKKIEIIFILSLIFVALIYAIFRAYPLLAGPSIEIYYPEEGDIVSSSTFKISGKVARAKEVMLQGRSINIDTEGNFSETLVSFDPYTIIVASVTDSYGSTITKTLRVIPR